MTYRFQQENNEWDTFKKTLDKIDDSLSQLLKYDPYQDSLDSSYVPFGQIEFQDKNKYVFMDDLFLLPSTFNTKPIDVLLSLKPPPVVPSIPDHPLRSADEKKIRQNESTRDNSVFGWILGELSSLLRGEKEKTIKGNSQQNQPASMFNPYELELIDRAGKLKEKKSKLEEQVHEIFRNAKEEIEKLKKSTEPKDNATLIEKINHEFQLPDFLQKNFKVYVSKELEIALVEFEFPDFAKQKIITGVKGRYEDAPKFASDLAKRKLVKQCLYSLIIRAGYLAASYRLNDLYTLVVINVNQKWFDSATGQPKSGVIASLQAPVDYLLNLNLLQLDAEACFKHLKGIMTPSLDKLNPIRPIFTLNKEDQRFIDTQNVDDLIAEEANLAAMPWEDFEHLVAQLFEWEFKKNNVEVRVTRASRDRGVDAVLFDPDPLRGGKYVLQAKRYTRTVDVSAVRDLYGTVMNEGANRGILITTSSYGPDAYEFAKDKAISLVDGPNLIQMLQKHGKKFKIDLEEARRLNIQD
jgi:restriction system protein